MTHSDMRHLIDVVNLDKSKLEEGAVDSIKKWIGNLGDPIKNASGEYLKDLEKSLATKYGASVPPQVKSANKTWMFGKLTYQYLYTYLRQLGYTDDEIDLALKNRIVTNTLNRAFAGLPANTSKPQLPLSVNSIKNNPNIISSMVDKKTQVYLSRAIASIIFDSVAHIDATKEREAALAAKAAVATSKPRADTPYVTPDDPTITPKAASQKETSIDELKSALSAIKAGLANMKGASL